MSVSRNMGREAFLPIHVYLEENKGIIRQDEPVSLGIPIPQTSLFHPNDITLRTDQGAYISTQTKVLSVWPDESIKWLLVEFFTDLKPYEKKIFSFVLNDYSKLTENNKKLLISDNKDNITVTTGKYKFYINKKLFKPFDNIAVEDILLLDTDSSTTILIDSNGNHLLPIIKYIEIEKSGDLFCTIKLTGIFNNSIKNQLSFFSRLHFYAGSGLVKIEFTIRNHKPAKHFGGYWDLGDFSSFNFNDLSITLGLKNSYNTEILWSAEYYKDKQHTNNEITIYQDSSGHNNWQSRNHINYKGEIKNSFRGYKVFTARQHQVGEGFHATPEITIVSGNVNITATIQKFWQNFPSSLEADNKSMTLRLFPHQYNDSFEMQGGEQKTQTAFIDISAIAQRLSWVHSPIFPRLQPEVYQYAKVFPFFEPVGPQDPEVFKDIMNEAIDGENSFFRKREIIDEYGWRNFGDIFADHEAYERTGAENKEPIISHYNNQYDVIYSFIYNFARTNNLLFFELACDLAKHVIDIDVYHTSEDRETYNKGLFWHTSHFTDANTATHRAFSKNCKREDLSYYEGSGGGHSYEHAYTKGLLYYYYMTGDESAKDTVLDLVSWVEKGLTIGCGVIATIEEHIKKTILSLKQRMASSHRATIPFLFDGPGRASGNALSVLLDAYELTKAERYLHLAEKLIRNCVCPGEDISARDMLNPNTRQMYTIFLHSLALYLEKKKEIGQRDNMFAYARDVLLDYAYWMLKNEYLFLNKPELLDYPNYATRSAQDIRKANVFLFARQYEPDKKHRDDLFEKADFFYNSSLKYLKALKSKTLTRPIAIVMSVGYIWPYFNKLSVEPDPLDNQTGYPATDTKIKKNKTDSRAPFEKNYDFSISREFRWIVYRIENILWEIKKRPSVKN